MSHFEMSLYKKPVYVVYYGYLLSNKFVLKTLKGCEKRIEKEGIKSYKIYKLIEHVCDPSDNKRELIKKV